MSLVDIPKMSARLTVTINDLLIFKTGHPNLKSAVIMDAVRDTTRLLAGEERTKEHKKRERQKQMNADLLAAVK